jgi:hypothetical protein
MRDSCRNAFRPPKISIHLLREHLTFEGPRLVASDYDATFEPLLKSPWTHGKDSSKGGSELGPGVATKPRTLEIFNDDNDNNDNNNDNDNSDGNLSSYTSRDF